MLPLLRLQQVADSAFPIGSAAHSFGIEALVEARLLSVECLTQFLEDYLEEGGALEAAYCSASCKLARMEAVDICTWLQWNAELGARKVARESRDGSAAMGRRFLRLAANLSGDALLKKTSEAVSAPGVETHLATCFGFVAGAFGIDPAPASAAYLQQSMTALVSACQRLLPLGQTQAHQILWGLKTGILAAVAQVGEPSFTNSFTPLLDLASARHATLYTRLFMS